MAGFICYQRRYKLFYSSRRIYDKQILVIPGTKFAIIMNMNNCRLVTKMNVKRSNSIIFKRP